MPKSRRNFWKHKIERNKLRDREVRVLLDKKGWRIMRVWEHALKAPSHIVCSIKARLASSLKPN
jgi:DNA mismatch endonuclease (patch repair protein)